MIRPITSTDIPACVRVIRESFRTVADEFGITQERAPRFTAFSVSEERLAWQLAQGRPMFACLEGGEIVGYYSLDIRDGACELNNLCVLPAFRHRKRGESLLMHAISEAKSHGCTIMHLGYVYENERLRHWYEDYGFTFTGTQKFDFFPFTCGYMERPL